MNPTFRYHAVDTGGRRVRGAEAAGSAVALALALERRGLVVLDVSAAPRETGDARQSSASRRREVLEATRTLAALLPAGLPLARALATAATVSGGGTGAVLDAVRLRVERGDSLAAALAEHPRLFSALYVGLVRAGERSGNLAGPFQRLAGQLEREDQLRARLLALSLYPLLLAAAGGVAVTVLLLFVLPRFAELLQDTGATLPRSTALALATSAALRRLWPVGALAGVALGLCVVWLRRAEEGREVCSRLLLQVPVIRGLRRHALAARFARLLGTLLGGGAPLLPALDDTIDCLDDAVARGVAVQVRVRVREGVALHAAVAEGGLFPPLLPKLTAVGEESGRLAEFLLKAADILDERTTRLVERAVALAEPALIVVFGGLVGFVALSLLQAIYSVNAGQFR